EKCECFADRQFENIRDRFVLDCHFEYFRPEALAVAVGAAQIDVRQELHLDVFETVAAARRAAAVAGIEAESAARVAAFPGKRSARVELADRVESANVARGV